MNVDSGDLLAEMGERDRGDYVDPITAVSGAWGSTELLYPCNIQKKAQFCIVNREKCHVEEQNCCMLSYRGFARCLEPRSPLVILILASSRYGSSGSKLLTDSTLLANEYGLDAKQKSSPGEGEKLFALQDSSVQCSDEHWK